MDTMNQEPQTFKTGEEILRSPSSRFHELTQEIDQLEDGDAKQNELLRERTKLIAKLPDELNTAVDLKGLPEEVVDYVDFLGVSANRNLRENNSFGQRVNLIPKGHKIGEPNSLDNLIGDFFDKKP